MEIHDNASTSDRLKANVMAEIAVLMHSELEEHNRMDTEVSCVHACL
jgi:hypothetical protein